MKKSYKKKKAYQLACKLQNQKGMLNDAEGVWKPASTWNNSMSRDGMAGSVKG